MFNINQKPEFTRTVTVRTPEGGSVRIDTFQASYRVLDDDTLAGFDTMTLDGQKDFIRATVTSLGDIIDDDKNPIPYSSDLLEQVMTNSFARNALMETYSLAYVESQVGNSDGRGGRGRKAV